MKFFLKVSQCRKKLKGRTLWDFSTSTLLGDPVWGDPLVEKTLKKSRTVPKKTEREDPLGFFNIHSVGGSSLGGPFGGKNFEKKSHSAEKN